MKSHAPRSPQTQRGLRKRREVRGLLDMRENAAADLRHVEMVRPFGKEFFEVKNPGSDQTYIVASQTGGRTFKPGSSVVAASEHGTPGEFVLGGAPAGKKGGGATTKRRRSTGHNDAEPNQFAFGDDGTNMWAMLYNDGTYMSTRALVTSVSGQYTGCILSDSSETVGEGCLLMQDGETLKVWDVDNAIFYTYVTPLGWTNPTQLYYQGGFLYWCEVEDIPEAEVGVGDPTFDLRIRKAATDLTGVTTLATVTSANANTFGAPFTAYVGPPEVWTFAVDADGAVLYLGTRVCEIINFEIQEWHGLQVRFLLAGGNTSREWELSELDGLSDNAAKPFFAATVGGASFALATYQVGDHSVLSKADNASTGAANTWNPSLFSGYDSLQSFNSNEAQDVFQATGGLGAQVQVIFRGGIGSGTDITSSIQPFDDVPNFPIAMYFFGE